MIEITVTTRISAPIKIFLFIKYYSFYSQYSYDMKANNYSFYVFVVLLYSEWVSILIYLVAAYR
jgi:hypothetical protein